MFAHLSPSASAASLEDAESGRLSAAFQADLRQIYTQLMPEVLALTHSDSGRILASKLYDCINYLSAYNRHYTSLLRKTEGADEISTIQSLLHQLSALKDKLKKIIFLASTHGLDDIEAEFKDEIHKINAEVHTYADLRNRSRHLDTLADLNQWSTFFYYGTIVAEYTAKGLQTFFNFLPSLLKNLGRLFPPIIIAVDAAKNLFDLIYSIATKVHLSDIEKRTGIPIASSPFYNKGFYARLLGNFAALSLNVATILIFTGIIASSPVGWALSAGVVAFEWFANTITPAWHAWKTYSSLEKQARNIDLRISSVEKILYSTKIKSEITEYSERLENLKKIRERNQIAEKNFNEKKEDAVYGLCSVAGSILLACAIFCPPLYFPAVALLVIAPIRNTVKFISTYLDKKYGDKGVTKPEEDSLSAFTTVEIEMAVLKNDKNARIRHDRQASLDDLEAQPQASTTRSSPDSVQEYKSDYSSDEEDVPLLQPKQRQTKQTLRCC